MVNGAAAAAEIDASKGPLATAGMKGFTFEMLALSKSSSILPHRSFVATAEFQQAVMSFANRLELSWQFWQTTMFQLSKDPKGELISKRRKDDREAVWLYSLRGLKLSL